MSMNTEAESAVSLKARAGELSSKPAPSISAEPIAATPAKKKGIDPAVRKKIGIVVGAVALFLAGYFIYDSYEFVSTDNAQVGAPATLLSAKVSGIIVKANVEENQKV